MIAGLKRPIVYLITRGNATPENFTKNKAEILDIVRSAVECGVDLIQIREKQLNARQVWELVNDAVEIARRGSTRILINEFAGLLTVTGADGVHLTENSPPTNVIRASIGDGLLISRSVHSVEGAAAARDEGADLAVFAPVFATPGKGEPAGLKMLAEVCKAAAPLPIIALGGVDAGNFRSVLAAGAAGFAAIRSLNDEASLRTIMAECGQTQSK